MGTKQPDTKAEKATPTMPEVRTDTAQLPSTKPMSALGTYPKVALATFVDRVNQLLARLTTDSSTRKFQQMQTDTAKDKKVPGTAKTAEEMQLDINSPNKSEATKKILSQIQIAEVMIEAEKEYQATVVQQAMALEEMRRKQALLALYLAALAAHITPEDLGELVDHSAFEKEQKERMKEFIKVLEELCKDYSEVERLTHVLDGQMRELAQHQISVKVTEASIIVIADHFTQQMNAVLQTPAQAENAPHQAQLASIARLKAVPPADVQLTLQTNELMELGLKLDDLSRSQEMRKMQLITLIALVNLHKTIHGRDITPKELAELTQAITQHIPRMVELQRQRTVAEGHIEKSKEGIKETSEKLKQSVQKLEHSLDNVNTLRQSYPETASLVEPMLARSDEAKKTLHEIRQAATSPTYSSGPS